MDVYEITLADASRYRKEHRKTPDLPIPGKLVGSQASRPEKAESVQAPAADPPKVGDEIPADFALPITKEGQSEIHPFKGYPFNVKDESIFLGLPFNRSVPGGYGGVFGTFFVCGVREKDFCSLTPEQVKTYNQKFHNAEILLEVHGTVPVTLKVPPKNADKPHRDKGRDVPHGRE